MGDRSAIVGEATQAALRRDGRRDAWLEQRLSYLAGEQARVKAGVPLRRFLRGAIAAYRRFLFTADPAHRFQCWAILQAVSAGLDHLERGHVDHDAGAAPGGPNPGQSWTAGRADRVP